MTFLRGIYNIAHAPDIPIEFHKYRMTRQPLRYLIQFGNRPRASPDPMRKSVSAEPNRSKTVGAHLNVPRDLLHHLCVGIGIALLVLWFDRDVKLGEDDILSPITSSIGAEPMYWLTGSVPDS